MDRRTLLRATALGAGGAALSGSLWQSATFAVPAQSGAGPYGALRDADANGIRLPAGFTSRVVARSSRVVPGTSYVWHPAPDGGACFADGRGWIYVSNAESNHSGGASAVRFDSDGRVTSAYRILSGTKRNCAGGKMPWRTWLSCEEIDRGYVYETDPWGGDAVRRPEMGRFRHEAAAADPERKVVYLTEDEHDGCFYRFRPRNWGDLDSGTLEVLVAGEETAGDFSWERVPDPDAESQPTRLQVGEAKKFHGGEGCYYANDRVWFTAKGENRVWEVDLDEDTYRLVYDDCAVRPGPAPLTGVDNITGSTSGDLYVAEDGGNMEINVITPEGIVAPILRIMGQGESEITGPAFNPAGDRLYFSSQRGPSGISAGGITYEVTGPFRV